MLYRQLGDKAALPSGACMMNIDITCQRPNALYLLLFLIPAVIVSVMQCRKIVKKAMITK